MGPSAWRPLAVARGGSLTPGKGQKGLRREAGRHTSSDVLSVGNGGSETMCCRSALRKDSAYEAARGTRQPPGGASLRASRLSHVAEKRVSRSRCPSGHPRTGASFLAHMGAAAHDANESPGGT